MITFVGFLIATGAGAASVRVRAAANLPVAVARVTAGPAGTLACFDWKSHRLRAVTAHGADAKIDFALPAAARITNIGGGDGQTVVTTAQHGTFVLGPDGTVRSRFAMQSFTPYIAAVTDGDAAFGIGSAGDASGHIRAEWLVTRVDLKTPSAAPHEIVTDDAFADPFSRSVYPLGYLLLSADRSTLFVLWEGSPVLYAVPASGGAPRRIALTSGADAPPQATPALRASLMADRNAFYQIRSKYRWPQGLLHGPGDSVAILFREPASRGNAFTVDIYARDGRKIGSTMTLDIGPRSPIAQARTVSATDGGQYIVVNEPNKDYSGVINQTFYIVEMKP